MKLKTPEQLIKENLIVKMLSGSHAYGMATPTSDIDYRGLFFAEKLNILTPFYPINEKDDESEEDTKIYEIKKFLQLYTQCNPNIVELLWTDESDIVFKTDLYDYLRQYNHALLSSKAAFTFTGYAFAQLKRIKGHNKWISKAEHYSEEPPRQTDYVSMVHNFTNDKLFKIDIYQYKIGYRLIPYEKNIYGLYEMPGYETFDSYYNLNTLFEPSEHLFVDDSGNRRLPLFIVKFNEDAYRSVKDDWGNFWRWKKSRNAARSELEEKHGYDTKHASHLVRLLRMGVEILRDEEVLVKRPDAQELLSIRNGAWSYDEIIRYSDELDKEIREKYYKETKLPKTPNIKLASEILCNLYEKAWG